MDNYITKSRPIIIFKDCATKKCSCVGRNSVYYYIRFYFDGWKVEVFETVMRKLSKALSTAYKFYVMKQCERTTKLKKNSFLINPWVSRKSSYSTFNTIKYNYIFPNYYNIIEGKNHQWLNWENRNGRTYFVYYNENRRSCNLLRHLSQAKNRKKFRCTKNFWK